MKRIVIFLFCLFAVIYSGFVNAATWITAQNGSWNDSATWQGGVVPSYNCNDTLYIRDTVYFNDDINLSGGALLQIDSAGGALCGHHNMTVDGSFVHGYGVLDVDTLFSNNAFIYFKGGVFYSTYVYMTCCGSITAVGTDFHIFFWQQCFEKIETPAPASLADSSIFQYTLFPNPNEGDFSIRFIQPDETELTIYNSLGQVVFTSHIAGTAGEEKFSIPALAPAIYTWTITHGSNIVKRSQVVIVR